MPTYEVVDNTTGKKLFLTGDSPPNEQESMQAFTDFYKSNQTKPATAKPSVAAPGSIMEYMTTAPDRPSSFGEFVTKNIPRSAANTLYGLASVNPATALPMQIADIVTGGPRSQAATADIKNIKENPSSILTKTWDNLKSIAGGIGAPFGLGDSGKYLGNMAKGGPFYAGYRALTNPDETPIGKTGGDKFVDAWTREPVQSTLAVLPFAKPIMAGARGVGTKLKDVKTFGDRTIKRSAGKALANSISKESPAVMEQAAANAIESDALAKRIGGGWRVGLGQQTEDPKLLALQRRLQMNSDDIKAFNTESEMVNNQAVSEYLDRVIKDGGNVDDVISALESQEKQLSRGTATANRTSEGLLDDMAGTSQEESGELLRSMAEGVKNKLRAAANEKYGKVPENMEVDSTPLYKTIQDMGDDYDAAFQRLSATPSGIINRAKSALEPQPSQILGPDGKPYNASSMAMDMPEKMTFKQIMDFRSQVTTGERAAKASGDFDLARKFGILRKGIDDTMSLAEQTGKGEGVQALRDANAFYRDVYVPTVRQGATARVLKKVKTGEMKAETALVGKEYFKPGAKGVAAADSFNRTYKGNAAAKQALKDHAANDLLNFARNPATGEINSNRVASWLSRHKEGLQRLNLADDFTTIQKAAKAADNARSTEIQFNKSRFGQVLQSDPDKAMEFLFSGSGARNSIKTMKDLMQFTAKDPAARQGLKRAFADMFMKKSRTYAEDMKGVRKIGAAKGESFIDKFDPAMKTLYSKEEMQALKDVHRAVEISNRINKPVSGVAGSQTADLLRNPGSIMDHSIASYLPLNWKFRALRLVYKELRGSHEAKVNAHIQRAMYDPVVAKELLDIAKIAKSKGPKAASGILIRNAGITSTVAAGISDKVGKDYPFPDNKSPM